MLIVVSGLPGTGKTAVAAALAARIKAVHLSIDPMEDAMIGAGLPRGRDTAIAAYEVTRAAAQQNLALGWHVVVDAVNDSQAARQTWRTAADEVGVTLRFVMLTCSSHAEHRRRLQSRLRGLRHIPEPTWKQVLDRAATYEPWVDDCLIIDTNAPIDTIVDQLHQALAPGS